MTTVLRYVNARLDAFHDVDVLKITGRRNIGGPLHGIRDWRPAQKILKKQPNCAVAVVARARGGHKKTFLQLQPSTIFLFVEKVFRGVSTSMHASLAVHGERLHDSDDPRVFVQPLGGKHTSAVDVPWRRVTEQVLLA